jgi:hypothetical protein
MKAELEKRIAELSAEIRAYPTPIARCDLHLPALLEERSLLLKKLELLGEKQTCEPLTLWINDGGTNAA